MAEPNDKGAFRADIPADAVQEALRSVERVAKPAEPGADVAGAEIAIEAEAPGELGALQAEVASLEAQLELSTTKGRETLERLKEEHERLLRAAADLENYRKRAVREREDIQKFGSEKLLKDLFPVVDNLDRALAAAPADDPLADGVKLVRTSLEQVLAKHGVTGFSAMGEKFDPAAHEALMQVPTREKPPGTVVLEHARGFKLHDRLVRPAMVGVAVEPPPDAAGPGTKAS
ncbi:MAG TPA: nucleotide exchange factor GrpE [Anaeromyxobacter sp.]